MNRYLSGILLFVLFVSACSAIRVNLDYDPETDFSGYRSFDWLSGHQVETGDIRADNPLLDMRIRKAVDEVLSRRGYLRVEGTPPDFYVGYHLSFRTRLDVDTMNAWYGYPEIWGGFQTRVYEYDERTLVIDIADARGKRLVWRGSGTHAMNEYLSPEKKTQDVKKVVEKILAQFPPGYN